MKSITMVQRMDAASKGLVAAHGSAVEALRAFHSGTTLEFPDSADSVSMLIALHGIAIIELADTPDKERHG